MFVCFFNKTVKIKIIIIIYTVSGRHEQSLGFTFQHKQNPERVNGASACCEEERKWKWRKAGDEDGERGEVSVLRAERGSEGIESGSGRRR